MISLTNHHSQWVIWPSHHKIHRSKSHPISKIANWGFEKPRQSPAMWFKGRGVPMVPDCEVFYRYPQWQASMAMEHELSWENQWYTYFWKIIDIWYVICDIWYTIYHMSFTIVPYTLYHIFIDHIYHISIFLSCFITREYGLTIGQGLRFWTNVESQVWRVTWSNRTCQGTLIARLAKWDEVVWKWANTNVLHSFPSTTFDKWTCPPVN